MAAQRVAVVELAAMARQYAAAILLAVMTGCHNTVCVRLLPILIPPQADEIRQLQEERTQLARIVEQGKAAKAELQHLQQQAGELSGVGQELQQTRAALLELQAVARQLEQHRLQISSLADQKAELEAALQQQAELTAEVSVMERDYNDMLTKARRACELQEQLPQLQVRSSEAG